MKIKTLKLVILVFVSTALFSYGGDVESSSLIKNISFTVTPIDWTSFATITPDENGKVGQVKLSWSINELPNSFEIYISPTPSSNDNNKVTIESLNCGPVDCSQPIVCNVFKELDGFKITCPIRKEKLKLLSGNGYVILKAMYILIQQ